MMTCTILVSAYSFDKSHANIGTAQDLSGDWHQSLTLPDPVAYNTDPPTDVSLASTLNGPSVPSDVSLYANCSNR